MAKEVYAHQTIIRTAWKKKKKTKLGNKINLEDNTLRVPHRGLNRLYKWNIISIKRDEVRIHEQVLKTLAKLNKPNKENVVMVYFCSSKMSE